MSKQGMKAAYLYGEELPEFSSLSIATESLLSYKEDTLLAFVNESFPNTLIAYTSASLKDIEAWYFNASCPQTGPGGYFVPHAIGFFFGETLCRSAGFSWIVTEFPFTPGRYGIGVKRDLLTIMLTQGVTPTSVANKFRNSLFRDFNRYAL
jgi:hypothetical protein